MKIKAVCIALLTVLTVTAALVRVNGLEAANSGHEPANVALEASDSGGVSIGSRALEIWLDDFVDHH